MVNLPVFCIFILEIFVKCVKFCGYLFFINLLYAQCNFVKRNHFSSNVVSLKKNIVQRHFSNDHDKCYADIQLNFLVIRFIDALMESLEALQSIFAMK